MKRRHQILHATLVSTLILLAGGACAAGALTPAELDSLWSTGDHTAALTALETTVARVRGDGTERDLIALLNREAAWRKTAEQPVQAEAAAREAMALAWALGDSALACAPLRWLGVALTAQGRNQEARAKYEALLELATRVGDHEHRGWANIGLGWDDDINRRSRASLDHYAAAAEAFGEAGNAEGELWGRLGVANARFHLGQYEAAASAWDTVAATADNAGLIRHEVSTLNNIAGLQFALGRPDISRTYYERAIAVWDSLGQPYECLPPRLNLGSCLALLGQEDRAYDLFTDVLTESRAGELHNYEARALRRLAKLDRLNGNIEGARTRFDAIIDLGDDLPALEILEALRGKASLLNDRGAHHEALAILHDADRRIAGDTTSAHRIRLDLDLADTLLRLDRADEARRYLDRADAIMGQARARHGLELASLRATCWQRQGRPDSALVALETAATLWEAERGLPLDPDWREERGAAGRRIFTRLGDLLAQEHGPVAAFDRLQAYKARTLRERRSGPEAETDLSRSQAVATLSELQTGTLQPDELLLDAYLGPDTSLLFAVTRDSCRLTRLAPDTDLIPLARRWHEALAAPGHPAPTSAWADTLLAPLRDLIDQAERIILAPDGVFNLLPLTALLPEAHCSRVPSASMLADLRRENPHGPISDKTSIVILHTETLPAAVWESRNLVDRYEGACAHTVTTEGPATLAALADKALVLHVATHAEGNDRNAWQSAVVCNAAVPAARWRACDITGLSLDTRLVVLASCESAAGRTLSGEGVQGLASAFLAAGVPTVLASLWPVDDDATAFFMSRFYEALADDVPVGVAHARAQAACRNDPIFSAPADWAGFVLIGDGNRQVPLDERGRRAGPWPWLLIPLLAGIGYLLMRHIAKGR